MINKRDPYNLQRLVDTAKKLLQKIIDSGIWIDDTLFAYSIQEHLSLIHKYFDSLDSPIVHSKTLIPTLRCL